MAKTTLSIDDGLMIRLREEAARRGTTLSALVESALRLFLHRPRRRHELPPLPTFDSGGSLVDVSDREEVYRALE